MKLKNGRAFAGDPRSATAAEVDAWQGTVHEARDEAALRI